MRPESLPQRIRRALRLRAAAQAGATPALRPTPRVHRAFPARAPTRAVALLALLASIALLALLSLSLGAVEISPDAIVRILLARALPEGWVASDAPAMLQTIVWDIRLARTVLAVLAGSALAMAGATMQGVFRNPLADPGIIGVSGGGAIGAITMIVLGPRLLPAGLAAAGAAWLTPAAAMSGALATTVLIYRLSLRRGRVDLVSMLLVGIAINALGGAFIGLVSAFVATAEELQTVTFWTLGSLGRATWDLILPAAFFLALPLALLPRHARALNALAMGEEDAALLGVDVAREKRALVAMSAALVGTTVALCGMIGFIPLVAPHIIRAATGADHRFLLPASALAGAALLLAADMAARTVVAPAELPLGIVTALFGAPVFLSLIHRRNKALG